MANIDAKVLRAVESALKKNPDATTDELLAVAKRVKPEVAELSKRQFHARYPLQIKRKLAPLKKRKRGRKKAAPAPRAAKPSRTAKPSRAAKPPRKAKTSRAAKPSGASTRESVRSSFLNFAQALAAADARKDVVKVVAGVDRYVDEVLEATGRAKG